MSAEPVNFEALLEPVLADLGYELWGVEFFRTSGRARLRVFIDSPSGITLDDCARASDQISGVLDVEDPIQAQYILEVSSPGLDRLLLKNEHFRQAQGKEIRIRLAWPVGGRRNYQGVVEQVNEDSVWLRVGEELIEAPLNAIKRANMIYAG